MYRIAMMAVLASVTALAAETVIAPLGGELQSSGTYLTSGLKGERFFQMQYREQSDQTYFWYIIYRHEEGELLKVTRCVTDSVSCEILFAVPGYEAL